MKYKTKILLVYGILVVIIITIFAIIFTQVSVNQMKKAAFANMQHESENMHTNVGAFLDNMEYSTTFLLSDQEVLTAITLLSFMDIDETPFKRAALRNTIKKSLYSYSFSKYFYRVNYFNQKGDFLTSNFSIDSISDEEDVLSILNTKYMLHDSPDIEFLTAYQDSWIKENRSKSDSQEVAGIIRKIQGTNKGYLEVQIKYEDYLRLFHLSSQYDMDIIAIWYDEQTIFSTIKDAELLEYYKNLKEAQGNNNIKLENPVNRKTEMVAFNSEKESPLTIMLILDEKEIVNEARQLYLSVVSIIIVMFLLSYMYINYFAKRLTTPIQQLKSQMDKTEINSLELQIAEEDNIDEIVALNKGYNRLMVRLNEGMEREKKLTTLQMQANFDALQAQINPHFIYNTLNIISSRGLILGDEDICDMCNNLSFMLRYSTGIKQRVVTIRQEIDYVVNYMNLLVSRFSEKFVYHISIIHDIWDQNIPKIVIQQLVENSVQHGYEKIYEKIEINIKGWIKNDYWYIQIEDNGTGFQKEVLENLMKEKEEIKYQLFRNSKIRDLDIGGLGIMNTYARLLLLYGEEVIFDFQNKENGACVLIGAALMADRSNYE